jgi:hypothetical protein
MLLEAVFKVFLRMLIILRWEGVERVKITNDSMIEFPRLHVLHLCTSAEISHKNAKNCVLANLMNSVVDSKSVYE